MRFVGVSVEVGDKRVVEFLDDGRRVGCEPEVFLDEVGLNFDGLLLDVVG